VPILPTEELAPIIVLRHNDDMRKHSSKKKPVESEQPAIEPESAEAAPPTPDPAPSKNPAAVALGKLGGAKGGPARAKKLTAQERTEIAKQAARVRWGRQNQQCPTEQKNPGEEEPGQSSL